MSCESLEHILDFQYTGQSLFSFTAALEVYGRSLLPPRSSSVFGARTASRRVFFIDAHHAPPEPRHTCLASPSCHLHYGWRHRAVFPRGTFSCFYLFSSLPFPHSLIPVIDRNTLSSARLLTYLCVQWITIRLHLNNCFFIILGTP